MRKRGRGHHKRSLFTDKTTEEEDNRPKRRALNFVVDHSNAPDKKWKIIFEII